MVLADLNPFERRVPQHGRIRMSHEGREYDVRTGTLPATRGLRLTLRLFGGAAGTVGLEGLGLSETNRERLLAACGQPTGLLLVSGPAGSGRTTLLYALLMQLNREAVSIVTVEDPVESQIPGVTQMHVNRKMGLTYPAALKAFLRHDPDVVMCGEVADRETAAALVEVGITGHLVLAAIAGTDAADGVARFLDLAPDRLVATKVLLGAAGVRLLRRVCEHCAGEVETGALDLEYLRRGGINEPPATLPQGAGCDHCRKTGYRGRTGIQEVMLMRDVPPGRLPEATVDDMRTAIHPSMLEDAAAKVVAGLTTVDEVQRVLAARAEG
jgi:type II secretory ATPase GspE/PulE/Tfp pilus assembly ATPase PilB-like protein